MTIFPVNATADELKMWKQKKNSEKWHYEKLISSEADEYREKEKERVTKYVSDKWQELIDALQGQSSVYKHIEEDLTPKSKSKEQSWRR